MSKPFNDANALIENMVHNHYQWGSEHILVENSQPKGGMYEVSNFDHMNAKVDSLAQKIDNLSINLASSIIAVTHNWEICGVPGHVTTDC